MKYFCHAVIHQGAIYYNTIINTNKKGITLSDYNGEEESTIFINGIIIVVAYINDNILTFLKDNISKCSSVEDAIEKIKLWTEAHDLFMHNSSESFSLIALSPELKILSTC